MKKPTPKKSPFWQKSPLIEEKDIFSDLIGKRGSSLFLGKYSMNQVLAVLKKRNFLNDALKRKLWPLVYKLDSSEFPIQRFQIYYEEKKPKNLIVDLKIREGLFQPKKELAGGASPPEYKFLIFDWLTLQNPLQSFSSNRPALPGQKHPGLGVGKKVIDIFIYLARITKKDGILVYPAYFHNALLFSRYFYFLNPEKEAEVMAIKKSFPDIPFKQLAWIVYLECLRGRDNEIYEWKAEEQVYSLNKSLKGYFDSRGYKRRVKESLKKLSFSIDWGCYERKFKSQKSEVKTDKDSKQ